MSAKRGSDGRGADGFRKLALGAGAAIMAAMILVAGAAVAGAGDASVSKKKNVFKPKQFKGTWSGGWENLTFMTSGPASIRLQVKGKGKKQKMIGTFKLGGDAFGCESIPARKVTMKKGKGKNRWNSGGFKANWNAPTGPGQLRYIHKKKRIVGRGPSPCSEAIAYSFSGKMTKRVVKASVNITLDGEPFAESKLDMRR